MNDKDEYVRDTIRIWTWAGFYAPAEVLEMLADVVEQEGDVARFRGVVEAEFARRHAAERAWPEVTDCDRLDGVFYKLHEQGVCALHNAGLTMSDGYSDVTEVVAGAPAGHYHAYCFYHGQDVARAVDGRGLMIAFGDLDDRGPESLAVGRTVAAALSNAGFGVTWNGSNDARIELPGIKWQRRGPPGAARAEVKPQAAATRPWWRLWG